MTHLPRPHALLALLLLTKLCRASALALVAAPLVAGAAACDGAEPDDDDDDDDDDGGEGEGEGGEGEGEGGEGEGEGEFPVTPEARTLCEITTRGQLNFFGAIAQSVSGAFALRCSAEDDNAPEFPDPAEIAAAAEALCADDGNDTVQVFAAAIAGGRVVFDIENIEACAALDFVELAEEGALEIPAPCDPNTLLEGLQVEGGPCAGQWECSGDLRCEAADLFVQELTCLPPAGPGDACIPGAASSDFGDILADGTLVARSCGPESRCEGFECVALADISEPCASSDDCLEGLTCDFGAPEPVCIAQGDEGDTCAGDADCLEDLACVGDRCVVPLADGASCVVGEDDCAEDCSVCRPLTPGAETTCEDRGALGAGCASDDDCRSKFVCDTAAGACVAGGTDGDACVFDEDCAAGFACDAGDNTCAAQPAVGGACTPDVACADGAACVAGTCRAGVDGDPCAVDDDCTGGLLCSGATATCAEAATSGPCSADGACADGFACDEGQCVDEPGLGDDCTSEGACGGGLYCDDGTCAAKKGAGAACAQAAECVSTCVNGTCAAAGPSCLTSKGFFPIVVLLSAIVPLGRRARRALALARRSG